MFRVTRYPMISKTESGRVGYRKKYRVAGRVRVPAGHWSCSISSCYCATHIIFAISLFASKCPICKKRAKWVWIYSSQGSRGSLSWTATGGLTKQTQPKYDSERAGQNLAPGNLLLIYLIQVFLRVFSPSVYTWKYSSAKQKFQNSRWWIWSKHSVAFVKDQFRLAWSSLGSPVFCRHTKNKEISQDYYFPSRHTLCTSYLGRLLGFVIGGINLNRSTSSVHSQPTANFLCYVLLSESAQY